MNHHTDKTARDIYISFFMFTTDMKPSDEAYRNVTITHMQALKELGYSGFEFPLAVTEDTDYTQQIADYAQLRQAMDASGLQDMKVATNVGATPTFDPSSEDQAQRDAALVYLKSRVDITAALRGTIMMGPIVYPYGHFPVTADNQGIWSDALQDYMAQRYLNAQPVLNELGLYAQGKAVKLAIEPITHWETPGPNTLAQLIGFLEGVPCQQVGVCLDTAHETLDGAGPLLFKEQLDWLVQEGRLHYAQISPPDRGNVQDSWIPWQTLVEPLLNAHQGPIAVEIFNAIPAFLDSLRLSRRKFWIPGEDPAKPPYPSAYTIAAEALAAIHANVPASVLRGHQPPAANQ